MNIDLIGGIGVKMRFARLFAIIAVALLSINACAFAQSAIDTTVVMRVSHMTQNAVVDAGEDLSIEVNIDGVTPEARRDQCHWNARRRIRRAHPEWLEVFDLIVKNSSNRTESICQMTLSKR